jgi:hypothetical protein
MSSLRNLRETIKIKRFNSARFIVSSHRNRLMHNFRLRYRLMHRLRLRHRLKLRLMIRLRLRHMLRLRLRYRYRLRFRLKLRLMHRLRLRHRLKLRLMIRLSHRHRSRLRHRLSLRLMHKLRLTFYTIFSRNNNDSRSKIQAIFLESTDCFHTFHHSGLTLYHIIFYWRIYALQFKCCTLE